MGYIRYTDETFSLPLKLVEHICSWFKSLCWNESSAVNNSIVFVISTIKTGSNEQRFTVMFRINTANSIFSRQRMTWHLYRATAAFIHSYAWVANVILSHQFIPLVCALHRKWISETNVCSLQTLLHASSSKLLTAYRINGSYVCFKPGECIISPNVCLDCPEDINVSYKYPVR